jgi:hypothetical protein
MKEFRRFRSSGEVKILVINFDVKKHCEKVLGAKIVSLSLSLTF